MIDVTFFFDGLSLSSLLSTYHVSHNVENNVSLTSLNGTQHIHSWRRPEIQFSLIPITDQQATTIYNKLSSLTGTVSYTDPFLGNRQATMRVQSNIDLVFGLRSVTGDRYYKGGVIVLRSVTPL